MGSYEYRADGTLFNPFDLILRMNIAESVVSGFNEAINKNRQIAVR